MSGETSNCLFMRLEAPLQSWGDNSRWNVRHTRLEPTKSGVIGLLACAFGWGLDEDGDRRSAELAAVLRMGVRVERQGTVVRDYHTISGGVLSAEGKVKRNANTKEPETVESDRYYLADSCFLVAMAGPDEVLERVIGAINDPAWPIYLGRKSCPPSLPVLPALPGQASTAACPSLEAALESYPWLGNGRNSRGSDRLRCVAEVPGAESSAGGRVLQMRPDVPLSFATRVFGYRYVYEWTVPVPGEA